MYYVKRAIYGPDLKEQKRSCDALIRKNQRELDRQLSDLRASENKTKAMIKQVHKRNDAKSVRLLALEVLKAQKHREKLLRSKAQLNSIQLQVGEAFATQKLQGSMSKSANLMKEVNQLVKVPEIMSTMALLGQELIKSGIIDEMVTDTLDTMDEVDMMEEEATNEQIAQIVEELTTTKQREPRKVVQPVAQPEPEEVQEDEAAINDMRERLRALQN